MIEEQNEIQKKQGQRLKQFLKKIGITQVELGEVVKSGQSNISHVMNGKRPIPRRWFEKIRKVYPQINQHWILTGEESVSPLSYPMQKVGDNIVMDNEAAYNNSKPLSTDELTRIVLRLGVELEDLKNRLKELEECQVDLSSKKANSNT